MKLVWSLVKKVIAITSLLMLAVLIWNYPLFPSVLSALYLVYAVLISRYPSVWLLIVPAMLPVFDLAPWTGHFFFDEFDGLILTTFAVRYWRLKESGAQSILSKNVRILLMLFAVTVCISAIVGLWPFPELDANSFANYQSPYNSLRVLKGFFQAFLFIPLLNCDLSEHGELKRFFVPGMFLGLVGVVAVTLWERQVFSGLINFDKDFRVVASFSGMHTGGAGLDAYLAAAVPFAACFFFLWRNRLLWITGIILLCLGLYSLLVTFSRIDYLAFGVSFLIFVVGFVSLRLQIVKAVTAILLSVLIIVAIAFPVVSGSFMQKRFSTVFTDTDIRLEHWAEAKQMMDSDVLTTLFGMGLGSYPRIYAQRSNEQERPSTYWYRREGSNRYLSLPSGGFLYIDQRINFQPNKSYILKMDLRSTDKSARLTIPVCEKSLLHSFECRWLVEKPGDTKNVWLHFEKSFDSGNVGAGHWLYQRRPVSLSLLNAEEGTIIDIDNIQLIDQNGVNVVRNGDFFAGNDFWFFTSDNHLPWHIKNLWVHMTFEHGWLGVLLLNILLILSLKGLLIKIFSGDLFSLIALSSFGGLLTVGLVDSLFDFPRITLLFMFLLLIGFESSRPLPSRST